MISYHPDREHASDASRYRQGFQAVPTLDLERIAKCISTYAWSPIEWKDGVRKQSNFLSCHLLVFDFDTPEMTVEEAKNLFCDCQHVIGLTRSHQKSKHGVVCDRFRVVLIFDSPIKDLRTYRYTMQRHMEHYPVDRSCKDGARFFFPCTEIVSVEKEGFTCDTLRDVPDTFERMDVARYENLRETGTLTRSARFALTNIIPEGQRNQTFFKAIKDMAKIGMSPDEIFSRVALSPTYKDKMTPDLERELRNTVKSGVRSALADVELATSGG